MENKSGLMRWAADLRYNHPAADGASPGSGTSLSEPGFLARSVQRPQDVLTDHRAFAAVRSSDPALLVEAAKREAAEAKQQGLPRAPTVAPDDSPRPLAKPIQGSDGRWRLINSGLFSPDGLKHPRAWLPAKEEVFETPLERRRLEGRREFEGRLALVQHGAAGAKGSARL